MNYGIYKIYKSNGNYFLEGDSENYPSLGEIALILNVLNIKAISGAKIICGERISYTEAITLAERLKISMSRVRIEGIKGLNELILEKILHKNATNPNLTLEEIN